MLTLAPPREELREGIGAGPGGLYTGASQLTVQVHEGNIAEFE